MRGRDLWPLLFALGLAFSDGGLRAEPRPAAVLGVAAEREAMDLYRRNELIAARSRAEALIAENPDSAIGHFVLGSVLREAEGSLARGMAHLGRARGALESAYGPQPPEGPLTELHREILVSTIGLAGELEEHAFEATLLDYHDALYDPDLLAERAWLELKRGDPESARRLAGSAMASGDDWQRSLGRNALCAIESEAGERLKARLACLDALTSARARVALAGHGERQDPAAGGVAVHAYNAALAARATLAYDEAERLAREGTLGRELTIANPWRLLVRLFVDQARIPEAVGAAQEMQAWRVRLPAYLREQGAAETDTALALLLLVAGEAERALALAERALERPDRRGLTSSRPEQALAGSALLHRAAAHVASERDRERASARGMIARAKALAARSGLPVTRAADEERIRAVLSFDERLLATFRLYLHGGIEPGPSWLLGDLVDVLGPGVVKIVLDEVRRIEQAFAPARPLYDALEAEVELARRRPARALELADRALGSLPKAEALLAARTAAIGAEAALKLGDPVKAVALYSRALETDPGVVRRLGLRIPALVSALGAPEAELARQRIQASPRLRQAAGSLEVRIDARPDGTRVCLLTPEGSNLACVSVARVQAESPEQHALRVTDAFHEGIFAVRVGLSAADLDSLDGSNGLASQAQRARLREVLQRLEPVPP